MVLWTGVLFGGCVGFVEVSDWWSSPRDSFDTATPNTSSPPRGDGSARLTEVTGGCSADELASVARTDGWAEGAILHLFRSTDAQMEIHPMRLLDLDPLGGWDEWGVDALSQGASPPHAPGESTTFACASDSASLSHAVRLIDADGRTSDCLAWGRGDLDALQQALALLDPQLDALGGCRLSEAPTSGPSTDDPSTGDPSTGSTDTGSLTGSSSDTGAP